MWGALASIFFLSFVAFYLVAGRTEWIFLVATAWFWWMDRKHQSRDLPQKFLHLPSEKMLDLGEPLITNPLVIGEKSLLIFRNQAAWLNQEGELKAFALPGEAHALKPVFIGNLVVIALKSGFCVIDFRGEIQLDFGGPGICPIFLEVSMDGRAVIGLTDLRLVLLDPEGKTEEIPLQALPLDFFVGEPDWVALCTGEVYALTDLKSGSRPWFRLDEELLSFQRIGDELAVLDASHSLRMIREGLARLSDSVTLDRLVPVARLETILWESRQGHLTCLKAHDVEPEPLEIQGRDLVFWKVLDTMAWLVTESSKECTVYRFFFEDKSLHRQIFHGNFQPLGLHGQGLVFRVGKESYLWSQTGEAATELSALHEEASNFYLFHGRAFQRRANLLEEIGEEAPRLISDQAKEVVSGYLVQDAGLIPVA